MILDSPTLTRRESSHAGASTNRMHVQRLYEEERLKRGPSFNMSKAQFSDMILPALRGSGKLVGAPHQMLRVRLREDVEKRSSLADTSRPHTHTKRCTILMLTANKSPLG